MDEAKKYQGLCTTCKNAPTCTFIRNQDVPIVQCEEFECETAPKKEFVEKDCPPKIILSKIDKKDEGKYKGLCSDCENRKECTFPKQEGGVWHCEEYI